MENNKILLIDDEISGWYMDYYVDAFQDRGFEVTTCSSVEEVDSIKKSKVAFSLIGIDLIMPPGSYSLAETGEGTKTGLAIYHEIKDVWPNATFFFLTNLAKSDILEEARRFAPVFEKIDYTPRMLLENVEKINLSKN